MVWAALSFSCLKSVKPAKAGIVHLQETGELSSTGRGQHGFLWRSGCQRPPSPASLGPRQTGPRHAPWLPMGRECPTWALWPLLFMVKSVEEAGPGLGAGLGVSNKAKEAAFIIWAIVSETLSTQIIGHKFSSEIRE